MTEALPAGPSAGNGSSLALHQELAKLLAQGERVAVATVVRARGSRPREAGAKMLVRQDGRASFTIGGGALEATVIADCLAALREGGAPLLRRHDLTESGEHAVGQTCGGSMELLIEVHEPPVRLLVFGAGHVGRAAAAAAALAGLSLLIVDDRAEWLDPAALPAGAGLHRCGRDYASDLPVVFAGDCVAVMTRCHATDVNVLEALGTVRPRYLGMIGSRRKVLRAYEELEKRGLPRAWLETIHAPIGLDIGADTPGEIGLSVAAEIVALLRGSSRPGPRRAEAASRDEA